jgi:sodium-dependent dicarboxylate transporter 2/3/5
MRPSIHRVAHLISDRLGIENIISGDSRFLSLIHYSKKKVSAGGKLFWFVLVLVLAALLTYLVASEGLSPSQQYIFFLLVTAIGLWLSEAIPPFAVGILIIGFLVFTQGSELFVDKPVDVQKYVNTWSSPVIWLMLGGFFLAEAMKKTGLDLALFRLTVKASGKGAGQILLSLMLTTTIASMLMSNTATAAMMLASIMPLIDRNGAKHPLSKALLLGIPAAASVGGMGTIIGSPPNAIAAGALQTMGVEIDFLTWMYFGVPVAIVLCIAFWFLLQKGLPDKEAKIDLDFVNEGLEFTKEEKQNRMIVLGVLVLTVLMWMTNPLHGIPVALISGIPIVLLTMSSVIWAKDVRSLPWDTLMLVAGGLALGLALVDSGLAAFIVGKLQFGDQLWILLPLFGLASVVLSNIMSNTATTTILVPIGLLLVQGNSEHMILIALTLALSASCALFLPVSTPPNAIAFSTGLLEQKDFRKGGLFFGLLGPISAILWGLFLASFGLAN